MSEVFANSAEVLADIYPEYISQIQYLRYRLNIGSEMNFHFIRYL